MKLPLLRQTERQDFVVIDSQFPQKEPFAFRNTEINEYFKHIENFASYTLCTTYPDSDAWFSHSYGMSYKQFKENKRGYLRYYPYNASRIHYLHERRNYHIGLAYSFFLGETYVLLPFYEKHHIPFVFTLYPGGAFGLDHEQSDIMLRKLFQSPMFRGVIVTQKITEDYLLRTKLCPADKITYIYGGFIQFKKSELKPKRRYKKDKTTFDICFVAAKYSEKGVDKGYDLFIAAAKKLCQSTEDIMFHVVGGFDENDIDVRDISSRIRFYGYQRPDFFLDFFAGMDIFLSPNRPFKLTPGNFDGFPLGIDAGYSGVGMFIADELNMNRYYKNNEEIVIIPLDVEKITSIVLRYYHDPDRLYELSERGRAVFQRLYDTDHQISERMKLFAKLINLKATT